MTNVPDNMFVCDFVPETNKNVLIFTAGWAFKFVPLLGIILKDLAVKGHTENEIFKEALEHFKFDRPGNIPQSANA